MKNSIDYDSVAAIYDQVRTGDPEMVHQLLRRLPSRSPLRVLDIGCGTANNTLLLERAIGASVIGLDLSFGMLCEACNKAHTLSFVQAPSDFIPFMDSSFDFAFMTEVVHHLPDIRATLEEMHRITKPEGRICIVTQSHQQIEDRMTSRFFPPTIAIDQARYPTICSLEAHLQDIGFKQVHTDSHQFKPVRLGKEYLDTVEKRGYSMLHKISESEYEEGLLKLREAMTDDTFLDYSAGYSFIWASK